MKKLILLVLAACSAIAPACTFLDIDPETGLDENQVFSTWDNFKAYFNNVYEGRTGQSGSGDNINIKLGYPLYLDFSDRRFTWNALTDMCDGGRWLRAQQIKAGALGANVSEWTTATSRRPISYSMFRIIRVANKCIENIDMVQNAKQIDKDDLIGQAYFVRAFAHFTLCRIFGGMPYLDKALEADDEWDMTRLSAWETYTRCAEDLDRAYDYLLAAGKVRRDAGPGSEGHLTSSDMAYPNGVAAKALKARCLLYAASELNNLHGQSDWEDAAEACAEAIRIAEENGYGMLDFSLWNSNFYGTKYTNEQLWAYTSGSTTNYNNDRVQAFVPYCFSNNAFSSGQCPTQNFVDKFETAGGYPLNTPEERAAATAAGQYDEQNPYVNRDPRFDVVVIYNQKPVQGYGNASIYVNEDGSLPSGSLIQKRSGSEDGVSETFYYEQKRTGALSNKGVQNLLLTDPIIRLAELYLNYAEAANEAYGPDGQAPGAAMTALEALNTVRSRVGMPAVLDAYTTDRDALRPRIKNERAVELCFEGYHYYCDIRRWKDAPSIHRTRLTGMRVTKLKAGATAQYPTGFRYERFELPSNRQIAWKNDGMYYVQFQTSDLLKMKNYVPNEAW